MFAVEDTAVQITWRGLPYPRVDLGIGDRSVTVSAGPPAVLRRSDRARRGAVAMRLPDGGFGGPGAVTIDGLRPGTAYDVTVSAPGARRRVVSRVTTLMAPPGDLLCRFATINDIHLAERGFGLVQDIEEVWPLAPDQEPYTWRCLRAAVDEAIAWGAEALVIKGDLTADGAPAEFRAAGELLARIPVPVFTTFGNHEFHDPVTDGRPILAEYRVAVPRRPWAHDLPGIRLVLGNTGRPGHRSGRVDAGQREDLAALAHEAPGAAFVALHHQPQRWRVPNQYPPGIPGPEAGRMLDALVAANPASFVATGHTHRHRRHQHGPIPVVEIGSTKDYPGAWAGYAVHAGGIRQVVRRIAEPDVIHWTEGTARALGGAWGRWSPGACRERCFTHPWPAR